MIGLLLLLPGLAMAGPVDPLLPRATTCKSDNCLRAIKASAFPTRLGTVDCLSYFMTTVTPATSTVTSTLSFSVTSVVTDDITLTSVVPITSTEFIDATLTSFVVVTSTPVAPACKRQVTIIPHRIPSYASACSGSAHYSSACSCVGATATTITAAIPVTTTIISATVTPTTLTVLTTVETDFTTTLAATVVATTTDVTVTATTTSIAHVPVPVGYPFNCSPLDNACCTTVESDFSAGHQCFSNLDSDSFVCSGGQPFALCCNVISIMGRPAGQWDAYVCNEAFT